MNQQWMTTLLSKGIELEQNLEKKFKSVQDDFKKKLDERGIKLSPVDLAALIEDLSPQGSKVALSYALDILRPFTLGLGLRVTKISDNRIEMVIPDRSKNRNESGMIHEGIIYTAAIECLKLLWSRHEPPGSLKMKVRQSNIQLETEITGELRVRFELAESSREKVLSELRQGSKSTSEAKVFIYDANELQKGEIHFTLDLDIIPALEAGPINN